MLFHCASCHCQGSTPVSSLAMVLSSVRTDVRRRPGRPVEGTAGGRWRGFDQRRGGLDTGLTRTLAGPGAVDIGTVRMGSGAPVDTATVPTESRAFVDTVAARMTGGAFTGGPRPSRTR